jgi:hypothetical protein
MQAREWMPARCGRCGVANGVPAVHDTPPRSGVASGTALLLLAGESQARLFGNLGRDFFRHRWKVAAAAVELIARQRMVASTTISWFHWSIATTNFGSACRR